ncbi:MAG: hypothetical protein AMXMBFR13_35290 [Phycisphaerae bacterium]
MFQPTLHPFDEMVQLPEGQIRLASAALLFCRDTYGELQPAAYLARLDRLADRVERLSGRTPRERLEALRTVIHAEEEFHGNSDDYYDPRNSYLNEVLDRRRGIPISLAVVWLDVARRLGWPLVGVNFPGHFLVRYESPCEPLHVDPFGGGQVLRCAQLRERLPPALARLPHVPAECLATAGTKAILMRMLNNLVGIYLQRCEWGALESVMARQAALCPEDADLWFRRGQVHIQMSRFECAMACLQRALELTGNHPDSCHIRQHLARARQGLAQTN